MQSAVLGCFGPIVLSQTGRRRHISCCRDEWQHFGYIDTFSVKQGRCEGLRLKMRDFGVWGGNNGTVGGHLDFRALCGLMPLTRIDFTSILTSWGDNMKPFSHFRLRLYPLFTHSWTRQRCSFEEESQLEVCDPFESSKLQIIFVMDVCKWLLMCTLCWGLLHFPQDLWKAWGLVYL